MEIFGEQHFDGSPRAKLVASIRPISTLSNCDHNHHHDPIPRRSNRHLIAVRSIDLSRLFNPTSQPKMMRQSASRALRSGLRQATTSSFTTTPVIARAAASTVAPTSSNHAISNPTLANIEKRWEGMPLPEQAELWMALRDRMKENWNELTLQEKKAGESTQRLSPFSSFEAPRHLGGRHGDLNSCIQRNVEAQLDRRLACPARVSGELRHDNIQPI